MKVLTTKGDIDMAELAVTDFVETGDNHRKIATEYRHQGELVRRDVVVNVLRPFDLGSQQGTIS